jgi:hypothetical protein
MAMGPRAQMYRILAVAILVGVGLFAPISRAQEGSLPAEDPTREWVGREYADSVVAQYYLENPDGRLFLDTNQILVLNVDGKPIQRILKAGVFKIWKEKINDIYRSKDPIVMKATSLGMGFFQGFQAGIQVFATYLETGSKLDIANDRDELKKSTLRDWILSQAERSIYPHKLMAKALALTNGEMISAWALVWNVTSENYSAAQSRNYANIASKFASLTGERHLWQGAGRFVADPKVLVTANTLYENSKDLPAAMSLEISKRGDEFSYLYHRIGVELFSMVTAQISGSSFIGTMLGKSGAIREFLNYKKTAGLQIESRKRLGNDLNAGESGGRLYKYGAGRLKKPSPDKAQAKNYLRSNPGKFGKDYQVPPGENAHFFKSGHKSTDLDHPMGVDEMVRIFFTGLHTDPNALSLVLLDGNGELERLQRGLAQYQETQIKNPILNKLLEEFLSNGKVSSSGVLDFNLEELVNLELLKGVRDQSDYREMESRLRRQIDRILATPMVMSCNQALLFK